MEIDNELFREYQTLSDEDKEMYRRDIFDVEEIATILDYERFKNAIELMSLMPEDLKKKYNEELNIAEEVALTFNNECFYIAQHLISIKFISEEIYNLVIKINEQLDLLSNEHNDDNWTIQSMNNDTRWITARMLANEVCQLLFSLK